MIETLLKQEPETKGRPMLYYYLAKQLYALDQPSNDQRVLDLFRTK